MANGTEPSSPQVVPNSLARLASATDDELKGVLELLGPNFKERIATLVAPPSLTVPTIASGEPTAVQPIVAPAPPAPFPERVSTPTGPEFGFSPPPSFEVVPPDFVLYDPERSGSRSILGILHNSIELPKQNSSGRALVITCMEPTLVVDNSGRVFESAVGQDIIVEASFWLVCLVRRAMHKEKVGEVWLKPIRKVLCAGGDFQYEWEIRSGRLHDRETFRQMVQKRTT